MPGASELRCCTITIGSANVAGRPATTVESALRPPHEVPITTISYTLSHLPIDAIRPGQLLIARFELGESQCLLRPEREDPEVNERFMKEPVDAGLKRAIE